MIVLFFLITVGDFDDEELISDHSKISAPSNKDDESDDFEFYQ